MLGKLLHLWKSQFLPQKLKYHQQGPYHAFTFSQARAEAQESVTEGATESDTGTMPLSRSRSP